MHVVRPDIRITFGDAKKLSKSVGLQVLLGDLEPITAANPTNEVDLTRRWTLDDEM